MESGSLSSEDRFCIRPIANRWAFASLKLGFGFRSVHHRGTEFGEFLIKNSFTLYG